MLKRPAWIALVALAVIPYLRAVDAPLLYDDRTLLDNRWLVRDAGPVSVFQHDYWYGTKHAGSDLYRPLTVLSLAWNMRASATKEGIRAVNIAGHAMVTVALYWMLAAVVTGRAAWIGAALFAVHPLASEAVLWAVGRAEIFAAILGVVAFVVFTKLSAESGYGGSRLLLSVAAFFAALCFKESAATWLAIGAAWLSLQPKRSRPPGRIVAVRGLAYLAAFCAYTVLRASAVSWGHEEPPFVDNPLAAVDVATRAVNAVLLFARYLAKMVWPATLSVEYGFDQLPVAPLFPWAAIGAAALAASVAAAVATLMRRGRREAAFLVAFVPCAFAVTGNLAFPIGTIFAERLAYTPLLGACGLAGLALAAIPKPAWRAAAVGILLAACGARTISRCGDYLSLATLSEATAEASPRAVKALANAGRTRLRQGNAAGARAPLERAVAIWPDYAGAWRLLAEVYAAQGDATRAVEAKARADAAASRAAAGDEPL
jgi:tetratricopeptide (TPR) repeat protein